MAPPFPVAAMRLRGCKRTTKINIFGSIWRAFDIAATRTSHCTRAIFHGRSGPRSLSLHFWGFGENVHPTVTVQGDAEELFFGRACRVVQEMALNKYSYGKLPAGLSAVLCVVVVVSAAHAKPLLSEQQAAKIAESKCANLASLLGKHWPPKNWRITDRKVTSLLRPDPDSGLMIVVNRQTGRAGKCFASPD